MEKLEELNYCKSIRFAIQSSLKEDQNTICFGLGVTDPKGVFETTKDLHVQFGNKRVFDTPTSENAMTGIGVGAAIMGQKVIMTHQRRIFLIGVRSASNSAAKMHYVYGGKLKCPIVIRLI